MILQFIWRDLLINSFIKNILSATLQPLSRALEIEIRKTAVSSLTFASSLKIMDDCIMQKFAILNMEVDILSIGKNSKWTIFPAMICK